MDANLCQQGLTTDEYRVDPRRLYGDGPYPWEQTDAVPAGATSTA